MLSRVLLAGARNPSFFILFLANALTLKPYPRWLCRLEVEPEAIQRTPRPMGERTRTTSPRRECSCGAELPRTEPDPPGGLALAVGCALTSQFNTATATTGQGRGGGRGWSPLSFRASAEEGHELRVSSRRSPVARLRLLEGVRLSQSSRPYLYGRRNSTWRPGHGLPTALVCQHTDPGDVPLACVWAAWNMPSTIPTTLL